MKFSIIVVAACSISFASGFLPAYVSNVETKLSLAKSSNEDSFMSRRHFIAGASIIVPFIFNQAQPAQATYGADAKMMIPDVMQGISDR